MTAGVRNTIGAVALVLLAFAAGWMFRGQHFADAGNMVVRVDTVYFERPKAVAASCCRTVTVGVPRILFAPAVAENATAARTGVQCAKNAQCAGNGSELPNSLHKAPNSLHNLSEIPTTSANVPEFPERSADETPADSVQLELPIETRIYEDSLYRAQVSGPTLGGYRPTLDWVQFYNRTTVRTTRRRNRFAITAGVGAAYTPQGFQPTLGVQVGVVLWGW